TATDLTPERFRELEERHIELESQLSGTPGARSAADTKLELQRNGKVSLEQAISRALTPEAASPVPQMTKQKANIEDIVQEFTSMHPTFEEIRLASELTRADTRARLRSVNGVYQGPSVSASNAPYGRSRRTIEIRGADPLRIDPLVKEYRDI